MAMIGTGESAVDVRGLQKSYGDWPVLWDLDLKVGWGELLVVLGANGVGKTTLLKVLSARAKPDGGSVFIAGVSGARKPEQLGRAVGVVAHDTYLYQEMTCVENLVFYGRMFRLNDLNTRVEEVLALVGLESRAKQRVRTLSHGMQKRLSIARAILHRPPVLLLDEPEAGLDQDALDMLVGLLRQWRQDSGTIIMTTHNLEYGLAWGERVAILSGGKIAYDEMRQSLDVERFMGTYRRYVEVAP